MRMSSKERFCALLLIASLGACETAKVGYDYDRRINFQAYRTYEWMPGDQERTGDRRIDNAAVDMRIRLAVAGQLRLKGYSEPVSGPPDFYVAYHLGLKDLAPDVSSQYYSPGMAGRPFAHSADSRSAGGAPATSPEVDPSMTGTLLVDIIDVASNTLIWRGIASGMVDSSLSSRERDERIRSIVHEMFTHFPPQ